MATIRYHEFEADFKREYGLEVKTDRTLFLSYVQCRLLEKQNEIFEKNLNKIEAKLDLVNKSLTSQQKITNNIKEETGNIGKDLAKLKSFNDFLDKR